jgi:hypothetical protein
MRLETAFPLEKAGGHLLKKNSVTAGLALEAVERAGEVGIRKINRTQVSIVKELDA